MTDGLPTLDKGALTLADLAFMETQGTTASRVRAAIAAYLWAEKSAGTSGFYPPLSDLRAALNAESRPASEEAGR